MQATSKLRFQCRVDPGLTICARFDGQEFYCGSPEETALVQHQFSDEEDGEHLLEIELQGKLPRHTVLNNQGNIIGDRLAYIDNICLDDIALGYLFVEHSKYLHDFNGTKDPVVERFYGSMGCNGVVKFKFTSPVYIWLLSNM